MHLYHWTFFTLLLCLIEGCNGKFGGGRGGGFGRGSSGGFRGSSGARSSSIFGGSKSSGSVFSSSKSYGGSFKSPSGGRANYRTRNIGGSSYYVPMSGMRSRDSFRGSFRSSFYGGMFGYMAGRMIMHSAMTPMRVNNYDYYFNRNNYRGPTSRQLCFANVNQIDSNEVPFDTAMYGTHNTNEQTDINNIDKELANATDSGDSNDLIDNVNATVQNDDFKFSDISFEDGQKPKEIVWSCPNQQDRCCYMECCPPYQDEDEDRKMVGYALIGLFVLILLLLWYNNRRTQLAGNSFHGPIRRT